MTKNAETKVFSFDEAVIGTITITPKNALVSSAEKMVTVVEKLSTIEKQHHDQSCLFQNRLHEQRSQN
jgi:hypothetical protein